MGKYLSREGLREEISFKGRIQSGNILQGMESAGKCPSPEGSLGKYPSRERFSGGNGPQEGIYIQHTNETFSQEHAQNHLCFTV